LPAGEHSTERIAKAAGLNRAKVLARLQALQDAGEVQQAGKHWSTVPPATDLEAAFDRLQATTGNLRIIRERERVS
jgi:DNA-binding IclR family transcriptional regulator